MTPRKALALLVVLTLCTVALLGQRAWAEPPPTAAERRVLRCIRDIESRNNYRAVSRASRSGARHIGAYQFLTRPGDPDPRRGTEAQRRRRQDHRALVLYRLSGLRPWPVPQRRCA